MWLFASIAYVRSGSSPVGSQRWVVARGITT